MLKNITLSAEEAMIERARRQARAKKTTLNSEFRRWLAGYVESPQTPTDLSDFMKRFSYVKPGKTFTRDEMNER
jgi:hypothetical protein